MGKECGGTCGGGTSLGVKNVSGCPHLYCRYADLRDMVKPAHTHLCTQLVPVLYSRTLRVSATKF